MATVRREDIQISGFVNKLEIGDGLTASRRRWAMVASHCLYLYKNENDREYMDFLILPGCKITYTYNPATTKPLIQITEDSGEFIQFTPEDLDHFDDWLDLLEQSSSLQNTKDVRPISLNNEAATYNHSPNVQEYDLRNPYDTSRGYQYNPELHQNYRQSSLDRKGDSLDRGSYNPSQYSHNSGRPLDQESFTLQQQRPGHDKWLTPSIYTDRVEIPPQQDIRSNSNYSIEQTSDQPFHFEKNRDRKFSYNRYGNMAHSAEQYQGYSGNPAMYGEAQVRKQSVIETVPEDPNMSESMILATKPIDEIRRKYPVSGLAKRMSIAASDLLGKSHDELVLLLIQLNREKANLERWNDYLTYTIGQTYAEIRRTSDHRMIQHLEQQVQQDERELNEVRHQIDISQPLITFIDNIVKMGAIYGGDDLMFATEYRKHLVNPSDYRPAKANLSFMREVQERQIAKDLAQRLNLSNVNAIEGPNYDSYEGQSAVDSLWPSVQDSETPEIRITRQQLEAELSDLENIYKDLLGQKSNLSNYMTAINRSGLMPEPEKKKTTQKPEEKAETPDLTIKFPRRSTRTNKRSDFYTSMKRPSSKHKEQISPPKRQWSVYGNRSLRPQILDTLNIESGPNLRGQVWDPNDRRPSVEPGSSLHRPASPPYIPRESANLNYASLDWSHRAAAPTQSFPRQPPTDTQYSSLIDPPVQYQQEMRYYVPPLNLHQSPSLHSGMSSQISNRPDLSNTRPYQSYNYNERPYEPPVSSQEFRGAYTLPAHRARPESPLEHPHYDKSMTMPLDGLSMGMRSETDLRYPERDPRRNSALTGSTNSKLKTRNPEVQSAHDLRMNYPEGFTMSQVKAGLSRSSSANRLNAEEKKSHHSSVQEQLNDLLGINIDTKPQDDISLHEPKSPGVISSGSGRRGPLIKLNKNHFKGDRASSGTYDETKALQKLGNYLETVKGLEPGSVKVRGRFPGDPGTRVDHHHHHSGEELHNPYEEEHRNHRPHEDGHRIYENLADPPVAAHYPAHADDGPVRAVFMSGGHYTSSRDDDSLDRQQRYAGIRSAGEGLSDNGISSNYREPDESYDIDNVLSAPRPINIGVRYRPDLDCDERQLTPEEKKRQREKVDDLRRMIVDHSLQEFTPSEINEGGNPNRSLTAEDIQREKRHRENVLRMREDLAKQISLKSKQQAYERRSYDVHT